MTAREYLGQAYRLDQKIENDMAELGRMRQIAEGVGSPAFHEHTSPNRQTGAPFEKSLERIWAAENRIDAELANLVALREQIRKTIDALTNADERMVLTYRYLRGFTWEQIAGRLHAAIRTVKRWHVSALEHVVIPPDAIQI